LLQVERCFELDDAALLFDEMVRREYEYEHDLFNVRICLAQREWERHHRPKRSLFVLTAHKIQGSEET
jgi:hypothetical protein